MHSDSGWQDVGELIGLIRSVNGVDDVHVGAGEYFNFTNPEDGAHRDYETTVLTDSGKLYGYIRCHAAGTMDDPFEYYDMTISLYPDKKRDVEERLESVNEVAANGGEFNTASDIINKRAKMPNDASTKNVNFQNSNPNAIDSSVSISKDDLANADSNDINAIQNSKNVTVTSESRKYSKRQVELGRMLEMRRTGKVYSKKQLNEIFKNGKDF